MKSSIFFTEFFKELHSAHSYKFYSFGFDVVDLVVRREGYLDGFKNTIQLMTCPKSSSLISIKA